MHMGNADEELELLAIVYVVEVTEGIVHKLETTAGIVPGIVHDSVFVIGFAGEGRVMKSAGKGVVLPSLS